MTNRIWCSSSAQGLPVGGRLAAVGWSQRRGPRSLSSNASLVRQRWWWPACGQQDGLTARTQPQAPTAGPACGNRFPQPAAFHIHRRTPQNGVCRPRGFSSTATTGFNRRGRAPLDRTLYADWSTFCNACAAARFRREMAQQAFQGPCLLANLNRAEGPSSQPSLLAWTLDAADLNGA